MTLTEPETFSYRPGRGVRVTANGRTILVGNHALLREESVVVPDGVSTDDAARDVFVVGDTHVLGTIRVADTVRPEATRRR